MLLSDHPRLFYKKLLDFLAKLITKTKQTETQAFRKAAHETALHPRLGEHNDPQCSRHHPFRMLTYLAGRAG